ncbi:unnamed protein product [Hermetia illucens]|uniref:Insect allergen related repeat protein n=1 Tax=Hermetia illucens TaxID=343691 RepID=A0A7R8UAP7_HERIL|nr:uncharacterized protein LOC119660319 [Hermetia illucens]CAD7077056.1 unnamed protein product [Hermetia illucens]
MIVYYLVLITPSLLTATGSSTETFPVNDILADMNPDNLTYNNTFDNDLLILQAAGLFPVKSAAVPSQPGNISSDVNDFINLIPVEEVRAIIGNYYRNDVEVREGFMYLKECNFLQRLLNVTEIDLLVQYLDEAGLDVEGVLYQILDLIGGIETIKNATSKTNIGLTFGNDTELELSGGMHIMVDSVLEVIPQDEILNMFFEKMDSSGAFIAFFNKIREPEFGRLLQKLEDSAGMKYLIYDLHNHGINMEKIVDSLKNYFFLGTFN